MHLAYLLHVHQQEGLVKALARSLFAGMEPSRLGLRESRRAAGEPRFKGVAACKESPNFLTTDRVSKDASPEFNTALGLFGSFGPSSADAIGAAGVGDAFRWQSAILIARICWCVIIPGHPNAGGMIRPLGRRCVLPRSRVFEGVHGVRMAPT